MIKLERNEETAPGVNRFADVDDGDLSRWMETGKWVVVKDEPEQVEDIPEEKREDSINTVAPEIVEPPKPRRGRKPKTQTGDKE